jgi:EXLDI family protein
MMPNKTIYVSDADVPIFERAQELAGENLSSMIVAALRRFVAAEESRARGYGEVIVKVGESGLFTQKQFNGRELAKVRLPDPTSGGITVLVVYETAKERLAVYSRTFTDWSALERNSSANQVKDKESLGSDTGTGPREDWLSRLSAQGGVHRLDVYETVDELRDYVPPELHAAVVRALNGNEFEIPNT